MGTKIMELSHEDLIFLSAATAARVHTLLKWLHETKRSDGTFYQGPFDLVVEHQYLLNRIQVLINPNEVCKTLEKCREDLNAEIKKPFIL